MNEYTVPILVAVVAWNQWTATPATTPVAQEAKPDIRTIECRATNPAGVLNDEAFKSCEGQVKVMCGGAFVVDQPTKIKAMNEPGQKPEWVVFDVRCVPVKGTGV